MKKTSERRLKNINRMSKYNTFEKKHIQQYFADKNMSLDNEKPKENSQNILDDKKLLIIQNGGDTSTVKISRFHAG